nr:putative capsid protein [Picobirnavirus sp.]
MAKKNYKTSKKNYRSNSTNKNKDMDRPTSKFTNKDFTSYDVSDMGKHNDYEWYVLNEQLAKDVGRISFGIPAGGKLPLGDATVTSSGGPLHDTASDVGTPGIMTIMYKPGVGNSLDTQSAINLAARNMWSYIFSKQTSTIKFEANDMMLYITSMASAYGILAYMQKAYGLLRLYSQQNTYLPYGMLASMGIDPYDLQDNILDFRARINLFAVQLGARYVPKNIPFFKRALFMATCTVRDQEDENGGKYQIYQTVPEGFYTYNHTKYRTGGCAEYHHMWYPGDPVLKYTDLCDIMDTIVNSIAYDTDIDTISGVLQKAFGDENAFKADMVSEDFLIKPSYAPEIVDQLTNLVCLGRPARCTLRLADDTGDIDFNSDDIFQKPGGIIYYVPTVTAEFDLSDREALLNYPNVNPEINQVIEGTRLISAGGLQNSGFGYSWNYDTLEWEEYQMPVNYNFTCGCEHVVGISVFTSRFANDGTRTYTYLDWGFGPTATSYPVIRRDSSYDYNTQNSQFCGIVENLMLVSNFDWHPRLYPIYIHGSGPDEDWEGLIFTSMGDLHTYTSIDSDKLEQINRICMQGLFKVPALGTWNP